ncbi:MAG TPA: CPBP family intramembrane metalloprotease [Armatimonadetes bacterium]|nr:CPBP family intramembrane metalloprotease [Armatimonadota bacterium]
MGNCRGMKLASSFCFKSSKARRKSAFSRSILLIRKLKTLPPLRTNIPVHILYETLVIYLFLTELIAPYIIAWLFGSWRMGTPAISSPRIAPSLLIMEAITALSLIWFAFVLRAQRLKWSEVGWSRTPVLRESLNGFATYIATLPWLWGAALLSMFLSRWWAGRVAPPEHPIIHILIAHQDWITLLTVVLVGSIVAPIIEETIFRGIFYTALRQHLGVLSSAIISATLFALLHPQSVIGACPLLVLGVAFALLYEARRSLIAVVVTHALVNCVSIVLLILLTAI